MATLSFDRLTLVVTVDAPATIVTVQELYDACRVYEANLYELDDRSLISAGGKEALGGGNFVAITATLLNGWKLAFEARGGPNITGCRVTGGNLVRSEDIEGTATSADAEGDLLVDTAATFLSDGILEGDLIQNKTDGSAGLVVEVTGDTTIIMSPLEGGAADDWEIGDAYCVTASNPIEPTAFTQVQFAQSTAPVNIDGAANDFVNAMNDSVYGGATFEDIMRDLHSMANGRIVESPTGTFTFYDRDNATVRYTLVKAGSERTRS